ncbi:MAG TPA: hypothetical protein VIL46_09705 [Gemmataceae bacterium]
MVKKLLCFAAAVAVGGYLLSGTRVGSYVSTAYDRARKSVEESVPPEVELDRIRHEVAHLDKDIDKLKGQLAEEIVAVDMLSDEVADERVRLEQEEAFLRARGEELKNAAENVKLGGRLVSVDEAKEELSLAVDRHTRARAEFATKEKTLEVRTRTRDLVKKQLEALIRQKSELETAVAELEAELRLAELEQIESAYQDDNTRLSDVKQSLKDLKKRINVQREKLRLSATYDQDSAAHLSVDEILGRLNRLDETRPVMAEID